MAKRSKRAAHELLGRLKYDFLADFRADESWRRNAKEDADFYDGNQWTEEERQKLRERGQPDVTINRIKPRMDAIFGIQQALRVDTKAFPFGDKENEVAAISEFFRSIEKTSDFDSEESDAFEDMAITGRGWYEIKKHWDGFTNQFYVCRVDYEDVVKDRFGREADLSDHKRIHKTLMMELEDAKSLFPDHADKLDAVVDQGPDLSLPSDMHRDVRPDQYKSGSQSQELEDFNEFVDRERKRLRLVTTYYRSLEPKRLYFAPGETPIDITDFDDKSIETLKLAKPGGEETTQWAKKLNCAIFAWNILLEHRQDIRPHDQEAKFPFILVPGYVERRSKREYGLVRQMKDPQREVNKRRSKLLHLLNVNQVRFIDGAFTDEELARKEFVKPDGWIKINPIAVNEPVVVDKNLDLSQSHFLLLQQATQEVDNSAAGKEVEGRGSAGSGREFQLRQQQATQPVRKLFSNLRAARRRVALYLLDEYLKDNPEADVMRYDVIVEEAPESLNLNSETFEQLVGLARDAKMPIPIDMIIKVSPLAPNVKEEFMRRIQEQQAQQQAMAQAQMQMQAMGQGMPQQ